MNNTPLVSILIPCYNAERWVKQAIESALSQTWPSKEILVVDDGSTDRSLEIIRSFGSTIRWETGANQGANVARNRLLELSRGEWLQFLDADDYLLNEKISEQLGSIADLDAADVIYSPMTMEFWRNGYAVRRVERPIPESHDPWVLMATWSMPGTHAVLFRRSALCDAGLWRPDQPCCQEHELFVRLLAAGKRFAFSPRTGAIYRQWGDNTLCTRNPTLTLVTRLQVLSQLASSMRAGQLMTPERSTALALGRLECARILYLTDSEKARAEAAAARHDCPGLRLSSSPPFPLGYRMAYRLAGFEAAEKIASITRLGRRLLPSLHLRSPAGDQTPNSATAISDRLSSSTSHSRPQPERGRVGLRSPKVSILIPCFNSEQWIGHAIRSALAQTWANKEVVVVDDGSTDRSAEVIRGFGNEIRFEAAPHRGGNATRNRLLDLAEGNWVQYLDADDYLLPEKIQRQLAGLHNPPLADILYSSVTVEYWQNGQPISQHVLPIPSGDLWVNLVRWFLPQTGAPLWRRAAIQEVGGWKVDQPCCQEHELYFRLLSQGKFFRWSPAIGAVYRLWSTGTVSRKNLAQTLTRRLEIIEACERHLKRHGELTKPRLEAIATSRLECARTFYQLDRDAATKIAAAAKRMHPRHSLPPIDCFPGVYRCIYRLLGFRAAEIMAEIVRPWRAKRLT